jgi:hypothetical protein
VREFARRARAACGCRNASRVSGCGATGRRGVLDTSLETLAPRAAARSVLAAAPAVIQPARLHPAPHFPSKTPPTRRTPCTSSKHTKIPQKSLRAPRAR